MASWGAHRSDPLRLRFCVGAVCVARVSLTVWIGGAGHSIALASAGMWAVVCLETCGCGPYRMVPQVCRVARPGRDHSGEIEFISCISLKGTVSLALAWLYHGGTS